MSSPIAERDRTGTRTVVIGFFVLVGLFIGANVLITQAIKHSTAPYFHAQAAAQAHQDAIVASGVLDAVAEAPDDAQRLKLLEGAIDPTARDVKGALITLERASAKDEHVSVEVRSAGRDRSALNQDDVVIRVSFSRFDSKWFIHDRQLVERRGSRFEPNR